MYDQFVERAAAARHMTRKKSTKWPGRVWTGEQAREMAWSTSLAGLYTAIGLAKPRARIRRMKGQPGVTRRTAVSTKCWRAAQVHRSAMTGKYTADAVIQLSAAERRALAALLPVAAVPLGPGPRAHPYVCQVITLPLRADDAGERCLADVDLEPRFAFACSAEELSRRWLTALRAADLAGFDLRVGDPPFRTTRRWRCRPERDGV